MKLIKYLNPLNTQRKQTQNSKTLSTKKQNNKQTQTNK